MELMPINPKVDTYLQDGCMRCKYGRTPQCKVLRWVQELSVLRQLALKAGLTEEIKWGVPVYTHHSKNVLTIHALKASANIGFFKGVLLSDPHNILVQQGSIQSSRIIPFTSVADVEKVKDVLKSYIGEAIAIEESREKIVLPKSPEPLPEELMQAFELDAAFQKAFYSLTPGRQRGYIIHFSQPTQAKTRMSRIAKYKEQICNGIGLHDKYLRE